MADPAERPDSTSSDPSTPAGPDQQRPGPQRPDLQDTGPRTTERHRQQPSFWKELPVILLAALVLSLLIKTFLVQAFYIPSGSMENTLLEGDRVFVNKLSTRVGEIERGDVVVFHDPTDWLNAPPVHGGGRVQEALRSGLEFVGLLPAATGDDLIKRVVGVEGDHVTCQDGQVVVNGHALDASYVFPGDPPCEDGTFDVVVPEDSLWVMGDHRTISEDSRAHQDDALSGFVPVDEVIGRAFVIIWPFDRAGLLSRPDTFAEIPEEPPAGSAPSTGADLPSSPSTGEPGSLPTGPAGQPDGSGSAG